MNAQHLEAMTELKEQHRRESAALQDEMREQQRLALGGLAQGLEEKHRGEVEALEAAVVAAGTWFRRRLIRLLAPRPPAHRTEERRVAVVVGA